MSGKLGGDPRGTPPTIGEFMYNVVLFYPDRVGVVEGAQDLIDAQRVFESSTALGFRIRSVKVKRKKRSQYDKRAKNF